MAVFLRVFDPAGDGFIRGAARILWAEISMAFPAKISDVIDLTLYNALSGWNDLGATKTGIQISLTNTEESFDVDQVYGDLLAQPTGWEMSVSTALAEMTVDNLSLAWEGSSTTTDALSVPGGLPRAEKWIGLGTPTGYKRRRLAVLFQRSDGTLRVRGYFFRIAQRSPQDSSVNHSKTGEQQSIQVRFRIFPDLSVSNILQRFGVVRDQV